MHRTAKLMQGWLLLHENMNKIFHDNDDDGNFSDFQPVILMIILLVKKISTAAVNVIPCKSMVIMDKNAQLQQPHVFLCNLQCNVCLEKGFQTFSSCGLLSVMLSKVAPKIEKRKYNKLRTDLFHHDPLSYFKLILKVTGLVLTVINNL